MSKLSSELRILKHLWKWKCATTATLAAVYYSKYKPDTAYKKLLVLARVGLITSRWSLERKYHLWVMTDKGYRTIKPYLVPLVQDGYRSEALWHDYMASVVQLGEWAARTPEQGLLLSEQELRRVEPEFLPKGLPPLEDHRSDGLWFNRVGDRKILGSLEIQNSPRAAQHLESVFYWYDLYREIDFVVWISRNEQIDCSLRKTLVGLDIESADRHFFSTFDGYSKSHWEQHLTNVMGQTRAINFLLGNSACKNNAVSLQAPANFHLTNLAKYDLKTGGYESGLIAEFLA